MKRSPDSRNEPVELAPYGYELVHGSYYPVIVGEDHHAPLWDVSPLMFKHPLAGKDHGHFRVSLIARCYCIEIPV